MTRRAWRKTGGPAGRSTGSSHLAFMRVLLNANAGSAGDCDLDALRAAAADLGAEIIEVDSPDDTRRAIREAAAAGVDTVVAAGGDGTVHLVADTLVGCGASADARPALGVLPLGTGNDFARTLALPVGDPVDALRLMDRAPARVMDLIRLSHPGAEPVHAVNVCAGGFSGAIDETMDDDMKATWGPLAYLVGAVKALPDLTEYRTFIAWDGGPEEPIDAFNIVVANGRTAGGGKPVAPLANPEDGLLDVVVVRAGGAADVARLLAGVLTHDYLADEHVVFNRVRRLTVRATPGMWFNVDGELRTNDPVTFEVVPRALRVRVGPDYQPAPDPEAWPVRA